MPPSRRLADLEETLDSLYDTLGNVQKRLDTANDIFEKDSIEKRIRRELLPTIREREAEYWQLLAQEANSLGIDDVDASNAVVEVVQIIETVQQNSTDDRVVQLLTKILNKLNEPGTPAAAKLKATFPLLPFFLSYEIELDTEGLLRRMFPTFRRLLKGAKNEKPIYPFPRPVEPVPLGTQRQIRLQKQIQTLQTIIDDVTYNQNFADARERFLTWRRETTNFLSESVGKREASNLAMIAPPGDIKPDKARLLNEAVQIRDYLATLSQILD